MNAGPFRTSKFDDVDGLFEVLEREDRLSSYVKGIECVEEPGPEFMSKVQVE